MSTSRRYPKEVRERAVRLVFEREQDYPSQWSAISSNRGGLHRVPKNVDGAALVDLRREPLRELCLDRVGVSTESLCELIPGVGLSTLDETGELNRVEPELGIEVTRELGGTADLDRLITSTRREPVTDMRLEPLLINPAHATPGI